MILMKVVLYLYVTMNKNELKQLIKECIKEWGMACQTEDSSPKEEASDLDIKALDIADLKKLAANPDPRMVKMYSGSKLGYVDMLRKKIEKLEDDYERELDIAELKRLVANPDPRMVKMYSGNKLGYVDMLRKKIEKLELEDGCEFCGKGDNKHDKDCETISEQIYGNDENFVGSGVSNWEEALQSTKVYNIEVSGDKKSIIFKLIDGGVAEIVSSGPMVMKPISHVN